MCVYKVNEELLNANFLLQFKLYKVKCLDTEVDGGTVNTCFRYRYMYMYVLKIDEKCSVSGYFAHKK